MPQQEQHATMIEFRNVCYSPDGKSGVLSNLNLSVAAGETLVLLGRSGCGKTTTLKMINRLIDPTEGEVLVEGRSVLDWDPIRLRRGIGYVIQEVGLLPHLTIERNIGLLPRLEGWPPERTRQRVEELLRMVALDPATFRRRYPRELSGGQRQRVGVARALAADPPILLMDEPFGALDPLTRAEIQKEFLALQQRLRKTIVFVTHDIHEALTVGTRIALLEAGQLVGTYSRAEFLNSTDPTVNAYLSVLHAAGPAACAESNTAGTKGSGS
ncbi:MAG TPA: ATP-binding cassette domain-containing protein [Terriglobia bacterium]|nr:ATP-binding cassette domain-containing protein [Terriglobia bacterium]